ncbi:MAG: hypothetical protein QOD51_2182, partial [Candidatus Eremiobacteraeota bacterium]|nr:hypothetical protein [Candidatus Eremiobacteraeota bacterium]
KRAHIALLALTLAAAGCSGGSGGSVSAPAVPAPTSAPAPPATMSLSISIPLRTATSSAARAPRYLSDGTMALAVYDGATLLYAGNLFLGTSPAFSTLYAKSGTTTVTPGDCTRGSLASTCTLTVTTTAGPHTFGLTAYGELQGGVVLPGSMKRTVSDTGTPPTFTGLILSEGELTMTAVGGTNPAQTITLLGVADITQWFGPQTASFNQTATVGYIVQDARSGQIVLPGNAYDNGPVTITASPTGILTFTPISQSVPPATNGSQTFDVKCTSGSGGIVTFTASAGTHPNATYASGLTYSSSNYSNGTLSTRTFRCFGS